MKMKPINVNSSTYIDFDVKSNEKKPKFEVEDQVKISKCKNISTKDYTPNESEKSFVITKVKNAVLWTYAMEEYIK